MTLRDLDDKRALYTVPLDDFVGEVVVPAFQSSYSVDCMMGFFNSTAFVSLAPGLAAFLNRAAGTLRILASPEVSARDEEAMRAAVNQPAEVLSQAAERLLIQAEISESALIQHQYDCLAYMLAAGRLEMRFSWVAGGIFHPKVWIFRDSFDTVVLHGSSNLTSGGLTANLETIALERPWRGPEQEERCVVLGGLFERLWWGNTPDTVVVPLSTAIRDRLLKRAESVPKPTLDKFWALYRPSSIVSVAGPKRLRLPAGIRIGQGRFGHQGHAVDSWLRNNRRGILAMATGSGKTVTALAAAARVDVQSLLIVIAAPFRPLVDQWDDEVRSFGIVPLNISRLAVPDKIRRIALEERLLASQGGVSVAIVTHSTLTSDAMRAFLSSSHHGVHTLLIADEVHNLGRESFVNAPHFGGFQYRIGLSATPERQFDPDGTTKLFAYFGGVVYEFPLEKAIGTCLVPYNYYVITVTMSGSEVDEYEELTERLRRLGYRDESLDPSDSGRLSLEVTRLLVKRRSIVESCSQKVESLAAQLPHNDKIEHVLIYASDKRPAQLRSVNQLLNARGIQFHQLTSSESCDRRLTRQLLTRFADGELQALTSKRVLDEGVNIPEVRTAYILASSTVKRQWVQRRGRLLRECASIGKQVAHLYDFVVIGPGVPDAVQRQELIRAREFATLSRNAGEPDGPFATIDRYR